MGWHGEKGKPPSHLLTPERPQCLALHPWGPQGDRDLGVCVGSAKPQVGRAVGQEVAGPALQVPRCPASPATSDEPHPFLRGLFQKLLSLSSLSLSHKSPVVFWDRLGPARAVTTSVPTPGPE